MVRLSSGGGAGFLGAVTFLTRVPLRLRRAPDMSRAVAWYGVVGALIGAAVGATAAGIGELTTPLVGAAVAVAAGMLITGAFHEDGLADVADAFVGGWSTEDRVRILKDPLHGTYGVAALCGSVVVRVAALAALAPAAAFASAVAAHALARSAAVGVMVASSPATAGGLGTETRRSLGRGSIVAGIAGAGVLATAAVGWWAAPLAAAAAAAAAIVGWWARRKIGGITGDVLGATEQIAECLCLIVAVALARHHGVWWH